MAEGSALRRVKPQDVKLGMYIHGFEGSWTSHPFWRSKFVIEEADLLAKLRASGVAAVLIDEAKGRTRIAPAPARSVAAKAPDTAEAGDPSAGSPASPAAPTGSGGRLPSPLDRPEDPARIVARAKQVMKQMVDGVRSGEPLSMREMRPVADSIVAAVCRNRSMLIGITRLKTKDEYTYMHSVAVCALLVAFGRQAGVPDSELQDLGLAGLLHDIGKTAVDENILGKPGELDADEMAIVRQHPARGCAILAKTPDVPAVALDVCLRHHERMDGTGYPHGLSASRLSQAARMAAICDVYDAMTSVRPYKIAVTPSDAIAAMIVDEGQFDRRLMFTFMQTIGVFPTGMLVRLKSNKLAVVVSNGGRTARPRVRAFHCTATSAALRPHDLILLDREDGDQIVAEETPEAWNLLDWPALRGELLGRA